MLALIDLSGRRASATLEVRLSNIPARTLYQRFGFRPVGVRPRYYSDNGEDALIMTTDPIGLARDARAECPPSSRARRGDGDPAARRTSAAAVGDCRRMSGRLLLAIETSCDETAVAVVEHGRRIHADVVASQVALHAVTGGIVPEVAARAHLRWMIPVLDEACRRPADLAGVDAIAVTEGPGLAGSLLVGITLARTLAWLHDLPLVPVNHHEGHLYAAWLLDPDEPERPEPAFPCSAWWSAAATRSWCSSATTSTTGAWAATVDDAAGEAFDKVGRMLGLAYPGGPAIAAAARGHPSRPPVPAGLAGRVRRLQLQRPQDRRAADGGRGARRGPPRGEPEGAVAADVAELAWAFQDAVVEVLATKTRARRPATRCAQHRGRWRRRREPGAPGAPRRRCRRAGIPLVVPRRACARTTPR